MPHNLEALLNLVVKPRAAFERARVEAFVKRWKLAPGGNEDANSKPFFTELFELFGQKPTFNAEGEVSFEKTVVVPGEPGAKRIDVYKRGTFVIEAKQGSNAQDAKTGHGRRGTLGYEKAMKAAFLQGLRYAQNVPEGLPPVLIVADVGYSFHVWTSFGGNFRGWEAHGLIMLDELAEEATFQLLHDLLTEPTRRDPQRAAARVTKEVAGKLGELAQALEQIGHDSGLVARFLMRCVFTMFAEDIGILEDKPFEKSLRERWSVQPELFVPELEAMWALMDKGGMAFGLGRIPHINGALFAEATALPLAPVYMAKLLEAARADWTQVEPSIFGTLLEQALNEKERHQLGAHYTPRAYIERLVWHTLIKPLRAEWQEVQAQITLLTKSADEGAAPKKAKSSKKKDPSVEARALALDFRTKLSSVRILDPACGSGNFLYVTFDLLKQLEQEVLVQLEALGWEQQTLGLHEFTVTPAQFFGIEIKLWARQVAELTLWIGALQWWFRLHPNAKPPEPILKDHKQIVNRDAVLSYTRKELRIGEGDKPATVWDQVSLKQHPVTGLMVPDKTKVKGIYNYIDAAPANWPEVDYIIGNPPFIGAANMKSALGEGYTEALRAAWPDVSDSSDFVMYWWHKSAELLIQEKIKGFGFITTNSISQTLNRRVIEAALKSGKIHLSYVVPDHPWIDATSGAAVRIAMTVVHPGSHEGLLERVVREKQHDADDIAVDVMERRGFIHPNLQIGPNVGGAFTLASNSRLASPGVKLHGSGFLVTPKEAAVLGLGSIPGLEAYIRNYRNGRDLTAKPRRVMVIDLYGLTAEDVSERYPLVYKHVFDRVKPERDANKRDNYRLNWWIFGETRSAMRLFLKGLNRYIATVETAKYRIFQFLDASILPDNMLIAIGLDDGYHLGILSSRIHVTWALATGGTLEDRPRYNKTKCLDTFPFPDVNLETMNSIRIVSEQLDAHRKKVLEEHEDLRLTEIYNVVHALHTGHQLDTNQQKIDAKAFVSSQIIPMHDKLDQLVATAYGWTEPIDELSDEDILLRISELNRQRHEEEKSGLVRWLRPDFQAPSATVPTQAASAEEHSTEDTDEEADEEADEATTARLKWPSKLADRVRLLRAQVKENPGRGVAWHTDRIASAGLDDVKEVLEALLETGVVFETSDHRWF
jgi:hypothetical protein